MLQKLKQVMRNTTTKDSGKKITPRSDSKTIIKNRKKPTLNSFGGLTIAQIQNRIENAGKNESPLISAQLGKTAQEALDMLNVYNNPKIKMTSVPYTNKLEEIAGFYSEGDIKTAIEKLKNYINEEKGKVPQTYWYMLMDCYQILNNRTDFERIALAYARSCGASPPSWHIQEKNQNRNFMNGKNMLILPPIFTIEFTNFFKDFLKAARKEKFCRINVSPCDFENSTLEAVKRLYTLFTTLRKYHVNSVLMGDNNLIDFCQKYQEDNGDLDKNEEFMNQEEFFSLFYLELLQWKGMREEFEEKSLEYAKKFHISSPGWEDSGVMQQDNDYMNQHSPQEIDSNINSSNIQTLMDIILEDFKDNKNSEIDLSHVNYIDFQSIGTLNQFIQEIKSDGYKNKEIIFKHPNEMMNVLFKMTGLSEFVTIIPKIR